MLKDRPPVWVSRLLGAWRRVGGRVVNSKRWRGGANWANAMLPTMEWAPLKAIWVEPYLLCWHVVRWTFTFGGQAFGTWMLFAGPVREDRVAEWLQMARHQACLSLDSLANDAVGFCGSVLELMVRATDRRVGEGYLEELSWLARSWDEDAVVDDSYWLARAMRRLEIEQVFKEIDDGKEANEEGEEAGC